MLRNLLSHIKRAYHFEEPKTRIYKCLSRYNSTDWCDNRKLFYNISSKQKLLETPNTQLIHIVPNDSYVLEPGLFFPDSQVEEKSFDFKSKIFDLPKSKISQELKSSTLSRRFFRTKSSTLSRKKSRREIFEFKSKKTFLRLGKSKIFEIPTRRSSTLSRKKKAWYGPKDTARDLLRQID